MMSPLSATINPAPIDGFNSLIVIVNPDGLARSLGVTGKYGVFHGMLAAGLHYLLVTAVPDMHGGFCLYNGGFTAALICLIFVPQLEKFCKTKEERKAARLAKQQ